MKGFKKLFKIVVAAACCLNCLMPMNVSATFDPCDVNHDGTVSLVDVVIINRFLGGISYYTNYNQLDANQSHTIDTSDSTCVLKSLLGQTYSACFIRRYGNGFQQVVSMPSVSNSIVLDNSASATNSRWYIGYSYIEHQNIPRYELTATSGTLNESLTVPRGLVNNDENRIVSHGSENTGIVKIGENATGFIVGDHQIATAAHCVHTAGYIRTDVEIETYDQSGFPTQHQLTVAEIHVPEDYCYIDNQNQIHVNKNLDYALITVTDDLSDYTHFSISNSYNMVDTEVSTIPVHVTGQPDCIWNPLIQNWEVNGSNILYTHFGSIWEVPNSNYLYYSVDTSSGQSGSPVYAILRERYNYEDYYSYVVLAIHARDGSPSCNYGPRMTKYHMHFYNNNPYAHYQ